MDATEQCSAAVEVDVPAVKKSITNLAQALLLARRAVQSTVFKADKNQDQGYRYVGHEQVLTSGARNALLEHGLVLEERAVTYVGDMFYETRGGKKVCWRWNGVFALVHAESGQEREYIYEATTQPNDKAAYVASTALDRVAHLRILQLAGSADENPEANYHDDQARRDGRPQDRTADPPPSNVRQLEPRASNGEASAAVQLFRPKLINLRRAPDLEDWLNEVSGQGYPDAIKRELWLLFAEHARTVGFNPIFLAQQAEQKRGK